MELKNQPNVNQEINLKRIIVATSAILGVLGIAFFIISNLGPSEKAMAVVSTRYAVANGNWNATSTWSATSGGTSGASIPVAGDIVYIGEGNTARTVTIPSNYTANCATLYLGSSSYNKANSLTFSSSTSALNVSGNVELFRPNGANFCSFNVKDGTANITGNLTFSGAYSNTDRDIKIDVEAGTLSIDGNLLISTGVTGNNFIEMSSGTLRLGGSFDATVCDFTKGTGTVIYDGSVAQTIDFFPSDAYYNLTILNTNSSGATLSDAITTSKVSNNITIGDGSSACKLNTANFAIGINNSKSLTINENSELVAGTSVITFGTSCSAIINGEFNTSNTAGFSGSSSTAIKNSNNPTITMGANSNIAFTASSAQTINARTDYQNLEITSGSKTLASGTFTINKNLTIASGATYTAATNDPTVNLKGNLTNNGTFTSGTGSFNLTGSSPQTISGSSAITFENLVINNTSSTIPQVVTECGLTISDDLDLSDGVVSIGNNNIEMSSGSTLTDGSANSFILTLGTGVFKWKSCAASNTKLFPVGHSANARGYAPLQMTFNSGTTTDDYSVRLDSVITANGTKNGTLVTSQVVNCTWQISEGTSGGSNVNLLFKWASTRNKVLNTAVKLQLLHYTSGTWTRPSEKKDRIALNLLDNMCSANFTNYTGTFSPMGVGEGDGSEGLALSFTGTPTRSGTAGAVGTTYTWNNVGTDINGSTIKAVIQIINKVGNASLYDMDISSLGSNEAWQPVINGSSTNGGSWGIEFRIKFYNASTNARLSLTSVNAQGIDIDGDNGNLREFNRFDNPRSYTFETGTTLTMSQSSNQYTFNSPQTEVGGIEVSETDYIVTCNYRNTDSINLYLGSRCQGGNCSATADNRKHSINFYDAISFVAPLPVKMTYFNARPVQQTALLQWATAAELNNSHFEIERSEDNKNWENIGKVIGNGNSSQLIKYEFVDAQPLVTNYYRLKQVDFDGKFEYSSVKFVDMKKTGLIGFQCKVYPNPTSGEFTIDINNKSKASGVSVEILDLQGKLVKQASFDSDGTNFLSTTIDISSFERGIYIVRVVSGQHVETVKLEKR